MRVIVPAPPALARVPVPEVRTHLRMPLMVHAGEKAPFVVTTDVFDACLFKRRVIRPRRPRVTVDQLVLPEPPAVVLQEQPALVTLERPSLIVEPPPIAVTVHRAPPPSPLRPNVSWSAGTSTVTLALRPASKPVPGGTPVALAVVPIEQVAAPMDRFRCVGMPGTIISAQSCISTHRRSLVETEPRKIGAWDHVMFPTHGPCRSCQVGPTLERRLGNLVPAERLARKSQGAAGAAARGLA